MHDNSEVLYLKSPFCHCKHAVNNLLKYRIFSIFGEQNQEHGFYTKHNIKKTDHQFVDLEALIATFHPVVFSVYLLHLDAASYAVLKIWIFVAQYSFQRNGCFPRKYDLSIVLEHTSILMRSATACCLIFGFCLKGSLPLFSDAPLVSEFLLQCRRYKQANFYSTHRL